jgi:hypothetical protein
MLTDGIVMAFHAFARGVDVEPDARSWPGLPPASAYTPTSTRFALLLASRKMLSVVDEPEVAVVNMKASAIPSGLVSTKPCTTLEPSSVPTDGAGGVPERRHETAWAMVSGESVESLSALMAAAAASASVDADADAVSPPPPPPQAVARKTVEIKDANSAFR